LGCCLGSGILLLRTVHRKYQAPRSVIKVASRAFAVAPQSSRSVLQRTPFLKRPSGTTDKPSVAWVDPTAITVERKPRWFSHEVPLSPRRASMADGNPSNPYMPPKCISNLTPSPARQQAIDSVLKWILCRRWLPHSKISRRGCSRSADRLLMYLNDWVIESRGVVRVKRLITLILQQETWRFTGLVWVY